MPIRFACEQCGQRLRVSSRQAGQEVRCPKCRHPLRVPDVPMSPAEVAAPPPAAKPPEPPRPPPPPPPEQQQTVPAEEADEDSPWSRLVVQDEEVEWVYEPDEPGPRDFDAAVASSRVAVPRAVIYAQGALLGIVGVVALLVGIYLGGRPSREPDAGLPQPCVLSGKVNYLAASGELQPDEGCVIAVFPEDRRPGTNERADADGLRPDDPMPNEDHPARRAILTMGGDYARAGARGDYRLRVPDRGSYFILFVSRHAARDPDEPLSRADLAQLGRYVLPATDLLGDRRHAWRRVVIGGDQTLDIEF